MLGRWQPGMQGIQPHLRKHPKLDKSHSSKRCRRLAGQPNREAKVPLISPNGLDKAGYRYGVEYIIMKVPNIVDISYGRGVGYTFTEHDLGAEIHDISATPIRKEMREKGDL